MFSFLISYFSHRIIDSFPRIFKGKNIKINTVLLGPGANQIGINSIIFILIFAEIVFNTMLYMIFQCG